MMAFHFKAMEPPDSSSDPASPRALQGAAVLFALVTTLAVVDVGIDLAAGTSVAHVGFESLIIVTGGAGLALLWLRLREMRRQALASERRAERLATALDVSRREASHWRREASDALEGLGQAIDKQFDRWSLSPAEREVAMLLLKGLSHKEIAKVRGVGVSTVRQQAQAAYRKGGLSGRADLAAFFLEDLLLPPPSTRDGAAAPRTQTSSVVEQG